MGSEFRRHLFAKKKRAVSEVVGAMLLLIVVVVAVGTFSYYLSTTQQQAQSRQTFINSVKNENLKIQYINMTTSGLIGYIRWINITIQNLNTQTSTLAHIQLDGVWVPGFYTSNYFYNSTTHLTLPARSATTVRFNATNLPTQIFRNQSMQIILLTQSGNYFETAYNTPSSIITEQLNTESYKVGGVPVVGDVPLFSAVQSQPQNSTWLRGYYWTIGFYPKDVMEINSTLEFSYSITLSLHNGI